MGGGRAERLSGRSGVLGPKTAALGDLPWAICLGPQGEAFILEGVTAFFGWKHWQEGELVMWAVLFGHGVTCVVARLWPNYFANIIEN